MITTQTLTLLQLAVVLLGGLALWLWPRAARPILLAVVALCYMATGLTDTANWRAYVDPLLFVGALVFAFWIWGEVRDARRR